MDRNSAWDKFYTTGCITDYLYYINATRAEAKLNEQVCKGNSDKRDGIQRK